jgi:hypothetical protein
MSLDVLNLLVGTVGAGATVICAVFVVLDRLQRRDDTMSTAAQKAMRPVWFSLVFAIIACGATGLDYYDRHFSATDRPVEIDVWGFADNSQTYFMSFNTKALLEYKTSNKLMMVVRTAYPDRDRMTDTNIEKSGLYTIDGNPVALAHRSSGVLVFPALQPVLVEFWLVLIPATYPPDSIKSLSDVEKIGGKLLAIKGALITGAPSTTPVPTSPPATPLPSPAPPASPAGK